MRKGPVTVKHLSHTHPILKPAHKLLCLFSLQPFQLSPSLSLLIKGGKGSMTAFNNFFLKRKAENHHKQQKFKNPWELEKKFEKLMKKLKKKKKLRKRLKNGPRTRKKALKRPKTRKKLKKCLKTRKKSIRVFVSNKAKNSKKNSKTFSS